MTRKLMTVTLIVALAAAGGCRGPRDSRDAHVDDVRPQGPAALPPPSQMSQVAHSQRKTTRKVAVLPFANRTSHDVRGDILAGFITDHLSQTDGYEVYSRTKLDKLLQEKDLQDSDLASRSTAEMVAKWTGVDSVVFGAITSVRLGRNSTPRIGGIPTYSWNNCKVYARIEIIDVYSARVRSTSDDAHGSDFDSACQEVAGKLVAASRNWFSGTMAYNR